MFSLRSISLFALACAAITSAAPANVARQLSGVTDTTGLVGAITSGGSPLDLIKKFGGVTNVPVPRGDAEKSLPEIFKKATIALGPVVAELKADVAIAAKVDVKVLAAHLGAVVEILVGVVADVKLVVVGGAYLTFNGVVYTAATLAVLVFEVIKLVCEVLHIVVGVVGFVDVVLGPLIIRIGALLVDIIVCVVAVIDIKVALAVLVKDIVADITFLQYVGILAALSIKA